LFAGEIIGAASTALNVTLDVREGKYGSAAARLALFALIFGLRNGINKLTKPAEKTAGVVVKTANDKALDTARDLEIQRMRQREAEKQRQIERKKLDEAIRLETGK